MLYLSLDVTIFIVGPRLHRRPHRPRCHRRRHRLIAYGRRAIPMHTSAPLSKALVYMCYILFLLFSLSLFACKFKIHTSNPHISQVQLKFNSYLIHI